MAKPNVVVLGSGMGGFGAAYRLHAEGMTPTMYDKNSYYGGHTTSLSQKIPVFRTYTRTVWTSDMNP
jgi:protoporphyrinogen oxidase